MFAKWPNHDRRPEVFRLAMEDFGVNHRADASEFFPQLSIKTLFHIQVRGGALKPIASMPYCFASQMARWL